MIENNALAVVFALGSALTIAWGTVVRHRIAVASGHGIGKSADCGFRPAVG